MHFQTPDVDKQREGDSGFWEEQEDGRRFSLCAWLYFTIFGAYNCKIHGNMTKGEFLEEYKDCAERKVLEKIWEVKQKGETDLDISKAGITDLRVLMILNNLKDLDVSFTQVEDLSPLSALMHLTFLDVSSTKINDLRPLSTLMHLTFLNISSTQVNDLRPLSTLTNLTWFNISSTQVNDLRPLSTLTNLIWLKASHTLVKDMKPIIHLIEKGLPVIYGVDIINYAIFIENCPLVHPPVEIAKQGNEAILRYFRERERTGTIKLMEARLLLVGQGASGKTTLRRKLLDVNADMPEKGDTTRGIEVEPLEFNTPEGDDFTLQIWDFGGQNIQHYAHQFFLSDSSVYALLSNEREQNPNFQYWLNIIEMLGGDSPVLVVQNEIEGHYEPIKNKPAIRERFEHVQEFHAVDLSKA
ncbi:MAG: hypothetical protein KDC61_23205, partial [Saprospiraceae bacterium]|nr:hypothetical protein [Saprospiraceae bacterium]